MGDDPGPGAAAADRRSVASRMAAARCRAVVCKAGGPGAALRVPDRVLAGGEAAGGGRPDRGAAAPRLLPRHHAPRATGRTSMGCRLW